MTYDISAQFSSLMTMPNMVSFGVGTGVVYVGSKLIAKTSVGSPFPARGIGLAESAMLSAIIIVGTHFIDPLLPLPTK